jgi:hypothetical protein
MEEIVENHICEEVHENYQYEEAQNNLSKSELKRLETEKRVKRTHELMELIDKANEEIQIYQDELWELLKIQIKLPNKQKRERKVKNDEESSDENKKKKDKEVKDIPKKLSPFDRFFKPPNVTKENDENIDSIIPLIKIDSIKKQRARAVSYDDLDKSIKKKKIEHFEVIDIFQIEGIEPEFVRECLEKCDITGDIRLFRKLFVKNIPKDQQIVRYLGGKNYEVKRNDLWIDDLNGNYIKNVLAKIFEKSYIVVNELQHYNGNIDQFLINQDHITQFDDDKYMEKFMSQISNIIDIKNKNP